MATTSLAQKLNIRARSRVAVLNAPKGAADLIKPLPDETTVVTTTKTTVDVILCFVKDAADLEKQGEALKDVLSEDNEVVLWFVYQKKKGKSASNLTGDQGWKIIYDLGYVGIASLALDSTWTALRFRLRAASIGEDFITAQYAGDRANLLPIYQQLASIATMLGPDVQLTPRQNHVFFSRGDQFALIRPTNDRVDLVLSLPRPPLTKRLKSSSGVGTRKMGHRVALTQMEDIDREIVIWLQDAYRAAGR